MKPGIKKIGLCLWRLMVCLGGASMAFAEELEATVAANSRSIDLVWMLVAAFLVPSII